MSAPGTLRVLDLTDDLASQAARLFVGLGADVVRIEYATDPPATDPAAADPAATDPAAAGSAAAGSAAAGPAGALHWHAGKRVLRLAGDHELDAVLRRLLPGADVVLESGPAARLRTPARRVAEPAAWQHVAHVVVTPFGTWGPAAAWQADDLVIAAAGGMAWLGGDPGAEPQAPPRAQATQVAGAQAAIAAMLALVARKRTGRGQLAEVSAQEAVAATLETGAIAWIHAGTVPGRTSGVYGHVAHRVFAAKDGYVAGGYSGPNRMWDDLLAWMAETGEAADLTGERWRDPVLRWQGRPHVDEVVAGFMSRRTADEIAEQARARALPWAAVTAPADLTNNPQLLHRQFFADLDTGSGVVRDVGFPYASPGLPRPVRLGAPLPVDTTVAWRDGSWPGKPGPGRPRPVTPVRGAALDGIRVLDLTWVLAGPYATKILGEHGADIVKIESAHRQDPTRFSPSMRLRPDVSPDESGYFLNFNRNKRSLALNLRTPAGQRLLRRLVTTADVVVENFSPGVLARWGLAYDQMRELNPDVILVSMAGAGQTGPWHRTVTFADTLGAMSGLTHETGSPPQGLTFGLGDMVAGNAAALAALDLLYRGHGGFVDLSQLETMAAQLGTALVEAAAGPADAEPGPLPRVFRTLGDDRWIAIGAVRLSRLAAALRVTAPSGPAGLDGIARTLAGQDADELAARLQAAGIPAYPVRDGCDLVERDAQLAAGGFYVPLDHPLAGRVPHEGVVARLSDTPGGLHRPAPLLGQHTDELLTGLLGLSPGELATLKEQGVLE